VDYQADVPGLYFYAGASFVKVPCTKKKQPLDALQLIGQRLLQHFLDCSRHSWFGILLDTVNCPITNVGFTSPHSYFQDIREIYHN
jgi:hypothetical protein